MNMLSKKEIEKFIIKYLLNKGLVIIYFLKKKNL